LIAAALELRSIVPAASTTNLSLAFAVISPVVVDAKVIPPVPELIVTAVVVVIFPIVIARAAAPVPLIYSSCSCVSS